MIATMILVEPDPGAAALAAARVAEESLRERAQQTADPLFFALSGGGSPRGMYERLARADSAEVPWSRVHVLWGDERCVPPDDPLSNYRMALETGLLDLPLAGVHRMPGELPPERGASAHESELKALFSAQGLPRLDLIVLGLGEDGHVASLLPGSPVLRERTHWVMPTDLYQGTRRLTLTLPVLASARRLLFLVIGAAKAAALHSVLAGRDTDASLVHARSLPPARILLDDLFSRVRDMHKDEAEEVASVTWVVDAAAASLLSTGQPRLDGAHGVPLGYEVEDHAEERGGS